MPKISEFPPNPDDPEQKKAGEAADRLRAAARFIGEAEEAADRIAAREAEEAEKVGLRYKSSGLVAVRFSRVETVVVGQTVQLVGHAEDGSVWEASRNVQDGRPFPPFRLVLGHLPEGAR